MSAPAAFDTLVKLLREATDVLDVQAAEQAFITRVVREWSRETNSQIGLANLGWLLPVGHCSER